MYVYICVYMWTHICTYTHIYMGFPGGSMEKNLLPTSGDADSVPGSRRSPGKENDNPVQYSCLGNPMDRGAWQATVLGVTENQTCLINGVCTCAHPPPQHTHTCVYMQKKKKTMRANPSLKDASRSGDPHLCMGPTVRPGAWSGSPWPR